ncbi:protein NOI4-like isoform X2 [Carex rostrata]
MSEKAGGPLPKFGEWDVNDPASAEGFTVIFNKARDEKKTATTAPGSDSPSTKVDPVYKDKDAPYNTTGKSSSKWFCCMG